MRVYVLVMSVSAKTQPLSAVLEWSFLAGNTRVLSPLSQYIPLKVWLYRDGFARFSNTRFTLNSIDDHCILTSQMLSFHIVLS